MNIFVLDLDPKLAAQSAVDKHVVKMPLETAQMLCTAQHLLNDGSKQIPYKAAFVNHPCSKWVRQSKANYLWLVEHGIALCEEYTHRYGRQHKCQDVIEWCQSTDPALVDFGMSSFAQAMPDDCKGSDPVKAYRDYYNKHKRHLFSWSKRERPAWIEEI